MQALLPQSFLMTMGVEWMRSLPRLMAACEERWSLRIGQPFPNLSFHYVAPVVRADGSRAVLKLGLPNHEFLDQVEALRLYEGQGAVRLLEADPEAGAMLLERLEPGAMLSTLTENGQDELATSIAARIMRQLWRPAPPAASLSADLTTDLSTDLSTEAISVETGPTHAAPAHAFPTVAEWAQGLTRLRQHYDGTTGPFPPSLIEAAETLYTDLLASTTENVLLHGDLHHFNILSAERAPWLVIDPKGLIGERGFEIGAFLQNPTLQTQATLARRLAQLSEELGLDRERAHGWALAQGVLSAWWSVEDGGDYSEESIVYCERIAAIR